MDKYVQLKELGSGSYGEAILVRRKADNQVLVAKRLHTRKATELESALQEAKVLRSLRHANIVGYIESFVEDRVMWIIMKYADGGDLNSCISKRRERSNEYWSEDEAVRMFIQLCLALKYIHDKRILHRDIKAQNVFLTSSGVVKLGDFGIARVLSTIDLAADTQIGTPYYMSPEICQDQSYDSKSDVWSLGVVLYEMLALELPFRGKSLPAIANKIMTNDPPALPSCYSTELCHLVSTLLSKSPSLRPNVGDLLKMPYLQGHIQRLISSMPTAVPPPAAVPVPPAAAPVPAATPWKEAFAVAAQVTVKPIDKDSVARNDFFRNREAARLNRERVRQEEAKPACFLNDAAALPAPSQPPRQKIDASEEMKNAARVAYEENRAAAQKIKEKVYADLGRHLPKNSNVEEQNEEQNYESIKPSSVPEPKPSAVMNDDSYREEARRIYQANRRAAKLHKQRVDEDLGRNHAAAAVPVVKEEPQSTDKETTITAASEKKPKEVDPTVYNDLARELRQQRREYKARAEQLRAQELTTAAETGTTESSPPSMIMPPPAPVSSEPDALSFEEKLALERRRVYLDRKALKQKMITNDDEKLIEDTTTS